MDQIFLFTINMVQKNFPKKKNSKRKPDLLRLIPYSIWCHYLDVFL